MISFFRVSIALCALIPISFLYADYHLTWITTIKSFYTYNERDFYVLGLCVAPSFLGHMLTLWGHYFRADHVFQNAISKVTAPSHKKQQLSFWDRPLWGRPGRFWVAVFFLVTLNITWFAVPMINNTASMIELLGFQPGLSAQIGNAAAYNIVACVGCMMFLVLRRSMLHALGFTYPDIIPLHRWLGAATIFWATVHVIDKLLYFHFDPEVTVAMILNFNGRGMMNMMGVIAYTSITLLGLGAIPQVRRRFFLVFISIHRVLGPMFLIGMMLHYPGPLLWYYVLPSFILFLVDRFVPKMIQAHILHPMATCTFTPDADIVRMTFTSSKPMKPYYPGDYITVQVPEIGTLYHPFTIASYWAEDPYTMTLFMRAQHTSKLSWTSKLAKLCDTDDKRVRVHANVDGVFGDRRHDYLQSDVLVFFIAGAALTTFMGLIKAIAAQIAATNEPLRMQVHLICTFRTRSELHAYGSFLHQITRDARFTSWLRVEIYVSRPEKVPTIAVPQAQNVMSNACAPNPNETLKHALSSGTLAVSPIGDKTLANPSSSASTFSSTESAGAEVETLDFSSPVTSERTYIDRPLLTYPAANSVAVAKRLAMFDLLTSAFMVLAPLAVWLGARTVVWEGTPAWCASNQRRTNPITIQCLWTYTFLPSFLHLVTMITIGYLGLLVARRVLRYKNNDVEEGYLSDKDHGNLLFDDGSWPDHDVAYRHGRMNVKLHIDELVEAGVGQQKANGEPQGLVSVFAGGPEGFVDMIEKHVRQAKWEVDFHRETWAP